MKLEPEKIILEIAQQGKMISRLLMGKYKDFKIPKYSSTEF